MRATQWGKTERKILSRAKSKLNLRNHDFDSPSALARLARSLACLREHPSLRQLELELDFRYELPSDEERLKLELAPLKGLARRGVHVDGVVLPGGRFLHGRSGVWV